MMHIHFRCVFCCPQPAESCSCPLLSHATLLSTGQGQAGACAAQLVHGKMHQMQPHHKLRCQGSLCCPFSQEAVPRSRESTAALHGLGWYRARYSKNPRASNAVGPLWDNSNMSRLTSNADACLQAQNFSALQSIGDSNFCRLPDTLRSRVYTICGHHMEIEVLAVVHRSCSWS
jgi:hypothetical protein